MPARKIPKNYRNVTGRISSKKSDQLISFESKLERDFYYIFDFHQSVVRIEDQPFKIEYFYNDTIYSYTPDVFLQRVPGLPHIIGEVKYYEDLKDQWPVLKPKFQAAMEFARRMPEPTQFVIFTDRCEMISNRDYLRNVHFLDDFNDFTHESYELVKGLYRHGMTIEDLLYAISPDQEEQMYFVPAIWAMVKRLIIVVDLSLGLHLRTHILGVRDQDEVIQAIIEQGTKV